MFYRITLDLAFPTEAPIVELEEAIRTLARQAVTINPGLENQERGFITAARCYHDETPPRPCTVMRTWLTP